MTERGPTRIHLSFTNASMVPSFTMMTSSLGRRSITWLVAPGLRVEAWHSSTSRVAVGPSKNCRLEPVAFVLAFTEFHSMAVEVMADFLSDCANTASPAVVKVVNNTKVKSVRVSIKFILSWWLNRKISQRSGWAKELSMTETGAACPKIALAQLDSPQL